MGLPILIIGRSGTGKTASLRNFKKDIGIINVLGKPLPFKNNLKPITSDDYLYIKKLLYSSKAPTLVIDDSGYLMTNEFMNGHAATGKGNAIFAFYNDLADKFWGLIRFIVEKLPEEKIVYMMMHEDQNDFGSIKPKTIGKMLDEKVCIEGMFTIVLRSIYSNGAYLFRTQTDGLDIAKTPMGMFEDKEIDNDLKMVDDTIREYYVLNTEVQK